MKESIEYFYNISIKDINEDNELYSFLLHDNIYMFVEYKRSENEINDIIEVSRELKYKNTLVFDIMYNKDNKVISKVDGNDYLLLKIPLNYNEEIDLFDMISKNFVVSSSHLKNYKNNWGDLWSKKTDYYEYQVSELGSEKYAILDSFSYYVGLSENAIAIVNKMNKLYNNGVDSTIILSHRRIFYPNIILNYYNPLSFLFDLKVRDIAEYIKSTFIAGEDSFLELSIYLKSSRLTHYEYNMFYARLLYPTYYFDLYEKIITDNYSENEIINIVKLVDEYELFLKKAYLELSKYAVIENIEWLNSL